jgi:hypothetical protein
VYTGPITVSSSETIEAIAMAGGYSTSAVASAAYTISPVVSGSGVLSVSAILPEQTQTITITGSGFGTHAPYNGDSSYISITDADGVTFEAGYINPAQGIDDLVTLSITSWTDTQIVLAGFTGSYGSLGWTLNEGDSLSLSVWNPQTGAGPYNCTNIFVGAGLTTCSATPIVATPTFSPLAGTYTSAQSVTISDATAGATIYYTTNGTMPTTGSTVYTGPITVSSSETIEAIATVSGYSTSAVASAAYTINPAEPQGFVLYSTVGNVNSHSEYPNSLITVDPTTGTQQLVGQSGQAIDVAWLTADPVNNLLYGTGLESTDSESTLYTINPNSGTISGQVTLSQSVSTIAASPQGTLYGLSGNTLGTINTATGEFSPIGTLSLASGYGLQAMTFSPAGILYGVEENGQSGTAFNQQLITLNPANGATVSDIGSLGTDNIEDITYAPDGNIYATNFSYGLFKIDPQTASNTLIGFGTIGDLDGIAAIAAPPVTAAPTFSPVAGTYTSAQTVTIADTTTGATIHYTTNGTTPTTSSSVYSGAITVSATETLEAIATASGHSTSAVASAAYTINNSTNPVPVIGSVSPAFIAAGGTAFTLTVNGSGFTAGSTVYWGTSDLATTYVSTTQVTAQVPAADIATGGITVAITVLTPSPGGGTSNLFQFEVDSASGSSTGPTFTSTTATVTAGSPASYSVTLPSTVESATVTCLNLPTGATCSYSATSNTVTITTTSSTPAGTYQVTVVFTETVSGAATSWILLPILLVPLVFLRRKLAARGVWFTVCFGLVLLAATAVACTGCGGGGSTTNTSPPPPQTHQATSSATVTLIVQ